MTPLCLWPFVLAPLLAPAKPPLPQFATGASAIYVDVVVSKGDRPVEGLSADNFEVKDEGVVQKVTIVSREEHAVHAVLALDLSDSLTPPQKEQLRNAAAGFLARLEPRDRATLITFTDNLQLVQGPADPGSVRAVLGTLDGLGSTAFVDALYAAIAVAPTAPGRAFVVMFSDGKDMCSWLDRDPVLDAVRHADVTVYYVDPNESKGDTAGLTNAVPPEFVRATGGRAWNAQFGPELQASFQKILNEVQNRYLLMYEPTDVRAGWHSLKVKLKNRRGDVRARPGYFAGP